MSGDGGSVRLVQQIVTLLTAGYYGLRGPNRSIPLKVLPERARALGLDETRPRSTTTPGVIYAYQGEGSLVGRVSWQATSGRELEVVCRSHGAGQLLVDGLDRGALDDTEQITDAAIREEVETALRTVSAEMAIWAQSPGA